MVEAEAGRRLDHPAFDGVRTGTVAFYTTVAIGLVVGAVSRGLSVELLQIAVGAGAAGYIAAIAAYVLAHALIGGRRHGVEAAGASDTDSVSTVVSLVVGFSVAALVGLTPTGREIAAPLAMLFLVGVLVFWAAMAIALVVGTVRNR